jgi:predicted ATP-grasp superfamily ATP-dependent carboligase
MRALACVIGDMDLLAPLGRAGIDCVAVAPPGSPPTLSRFVQATIPRPEGCAPDALLDALLRFGAAQPAKPVLYVQDDDALLLASRHRALLAPFYRLPLADAALVEALVDKARFAELAARHGLPVPVTRSIADADDGLRFPVIVKPLMRDAAWTGAAKALRADTPYALRALRRCHGQALLVQEFIPGPETRIESHHVYVDATGTIAAEFTGRKIRTWPAAFGHSTAVEITDAPDIAALGRRVVRALGLRGVAKLDIKRGADGALHLLEINPRFTLWHHLGAAVGVNIPALVHADLCGLPRPPVTPARPGAAWLRPREDWRAARAAGMAPLRWLRFLREAAANASFDPRDPMPYLRGEAWNGLKRSFAGRF